jgi:Ran GTPase-activating protein (RanGAP) involved in mRNA processing and transport
MSGNQNTILWLTPHAAVARESQGVVHYWVQLNGVCSFSFRADGKDILALASSPERLLEICDVVLRLLAASVVHSLVLISWSFLYGEVINTRTLAFLMEQCSSLKLLSLTTIEIDESHCRVLGAYSRPDLEIILIRCKLTRAGSSALAEVLGRDQGPTELTYCDIGISNGIESYVLVDGLHGNSRLKSLTIRDSGNPVDVNRHVVAIAGILKENKGLVVLDLSHCLLSDETWDAVCDSLKTHPTLQVLNLLWLESKVSHLALAVLKSRIQALVDMLK